MNRIRRFPCAFALISSAIVSACSDGPPAPTDPGLRAQFAKGGGGSGVAVKSTMPSSGELSTTLTVQVNGSGFEPGSKAIWALNGDTTFAVTGVKTNSVSFVSSTQLSTSITIESSAALELYDVVVVTPSGKKGIGIELFAVTPQFVDLGADDGSLANSINESGQIIGWGGPGGAFLWENGVITWLEDVGQYSPNVAWDINDLGVVVGTASASGLPPVGFTWSSANGTQLVTQSLGGAGIEVGAINNNGDLAGSSRIADNSASHATLWTGGSVIDLQLPNFPDGSSYSWGINDDGVVVGQYNPTSGGNMSFRWTAATGMVLIAPGVGNALRINDSGVIVGQAGSTFSSVHAYRWENGELQDLGTLGGTQSAAIGINDAGTIVGRSTVSIRRNTTKTLAFFWKPTGGMKALSTPPGRDEAQAWAINNNEWIVGAARGGSGVQRAVLWKMH